MRENDALAKAAVMSAINVNPGTKNSAKLTLPIDLPSPEKANLNIARNRRAVITGAIKV